MGSSSVTVCQFYVDSTAGWLRRCAVGCFNNKTRSARLLVSDSDRGLTGRSASCCGSSGRTCGATCARARRRRRTWATTSSRPTTATAAERIGLAAGRRWQGVGKLNLGTLKLRRRHDDLLGRRGRHHLPLGKEADAEANQAQHNGYHGNDHVVLVLHSSILVTFRRYPKRVRLPRLSDALYKGRSSAEELGE